MLFCCDDVYDGVIDNQDVVNVAVGDNNDGHYEDDFFSKNGGLSGGVFIL